MAADPAPKTHLPPTLLCMVGEIDAEVKRIASTLQMSLDTIIAAVETSLRTKIAFYNDSTIVGADEVHASVDHQLRFLVDGLGDGEQYDTAPAAAIGSRRAEQGVPLATLMEAYRIAAHDVWEAIAAAADEPGITAKGLLRTTSLLWHAEDVYTQAMSEAYRQTAILQVADDEAERSALTEALFHGRVGDDRTLWDIAQLLRLPQRGPYVVVAAACPTVGTLALPKVGSILRSLDIFSSWRLLPDTQIGIAHLASESAKDTLRQTLNRLATNRIGISPEFQRLGDAAEALRYARAALNVESDPTRLVTVFEDSVLAVAAVSSPEVIGRLTDGVVGSLSGLPSDERDTLVKTFRVWAANGGSVSAAATVLFCHPNTVRHRLQRIEKRTGRSLSAPNELAELCLAFANQWSGGR
jgi:hypothetical protein